MVRQAYCLTVGRYRWGRSQAGQNNLEYVGLVVLVAAVVAGLATTGFAKTIPRRFTCAVGTIFGEGDDCGKRDGGDSERRADGSNSPSPLPTKNWPSEGPVLRDHHVVVLPYPGEKSVRASVEKQVGPVTVTTKSTTTTSRSEQMGTGKTPDGKPCIRNQVKLGISTELAVENEVTGEGKKGEVSAKGGAGTKTSYGVTVTPEEAKAIKNGHSAPNPTDPRSIPVGDGVTLTQDYFKSMGMEAKYKKLGGYVGIEVGTKKGKSFKTAVQRTDPSHVRILIGNGPFVEQQLKVGAGYETDYGSAEINAGHTERADFAKGREITVDISTKKGWKTYQSFVRSGELPAGDAPGVTGASNVRNIKYVSKNQIGAKLESEGFSYEHSIPVGRSGGASLTTKKNADGTKTKTLSSRDTDVTYTVKRTTNAQGHQTDAQYSILLHDVPPNSLWTYQQVKGIKKKPSGNRDVMLTFDEQRYHKMRERALASVAVGCQRETSLCAQLENPPTTPAQVREWLRQHPRGYDSNVGALVGERNAFETRTLEGLLRSKDPAGFMRAVQDASLGSSKKAMHQFVAVGENVNRHFAFSHDPRARKNWTTFIPGTPSAIQPPGKTTKCR